MTHITSRENKILKHIAKLQNSRSYRDRHGEYIAEGARLCADALAMAGELVSCAVATEEFLAANREFEKKLDNLKITLYIVSEKIFKNISDTQTPQGILAVMRRGAYGDKTNGAPGSARPTNILILDGISEPGNMGTILRTANALGYRVMLTGGCVDIYNPKVVRTAMGAVFCADVVHITDTGETIGKLKSAGFTVIAAALENSVDIAGAEVGGKVALVIGSEANGISEEILNLADICVKIPMRNGAESLNAAVAAGILMYHFT